MAVRVFCRDLMPRNMLVWPARRFSLAEAGRRPRFAAMKNFFTSFFATLAALLVFLFGGGLVVMLLFGGHVWPWARRSRWRFKSGSYLVFDLAANIQ
jgi:hypothetical protein